MVQLRERQLLPDPTWPAEMVIRSSRARRGETCGAAPYPRCGPSDGSTADYAWICPSVTFRHLMSRTFHHHTPLSARFVCGHRQGFNMPVLAASRSSMAVFRRGMTDLAGGLPVHRAVRRFVVVVTEAAAASGGTLTRPPHLPSEADQLGGCEWSTRCRWSRPGLHSGRLWLRRLKRCDVRHTSH